MINKNYFILVMLALFIFFSASACEKQKAEWKGVIKEVDGDVVVSNPKEPIYNEEILFFEEDLSIGKKADEQEEYLFSRIMGLDADEKIDLFSIDN